MLWDFKAPLLVCVALDLFARTTPDKLALAQVITVSRGPEPEHVNAIIPVASVNDAPIEVEVQIVMTMLSALIQQSRSLAHA